MTRVFVTLCLTFASTAFAGTAGERITIDGSTGVTPLVQALAKAYTEQNPDVAIDIGKGLGTKARIEALNERRIDIAMASHGLDVPAITRAGMVVQEIGKIAVVFGVHESVSLASLSEAQICDVYAGKVRNWNQLGGPDVPLVVMTRPESEVDTEVVRDRVGCLRTLKMTEAAKVMPKAPDMAQALAVAQGAIGMTTMTVVEQSGGKVKALSLGGVAPTAENVQAGKYLLTRDSFLVTQGSPSPAVAQFLEFVRGPAGARVIAANGAIPVKP